MESFKVSILVPIYGTGKYISRCAHSLFKQTYQNIEYVFVDDCTPDDAVEELEKTLKEYPEKLESTHIIHHEKNKGIASTRNTLLDNAHGEFVVWVDSDDYVAEDLVERLVKKQETNQADIVIGNLEYVYGHSVEHRPFCVVDTPVNYLHLLMHRKTNSGLWAKLWRRSIYNDNDIRFPDGNNMEEDGYVSILFLYFAKTIAFCDNIVYYYDCTRDGTATAFSVKKYSQAWHVLDLLTEFFKDKEEYYEDLKVWKLHLGVNTLTNCAKDGNQHEFFKTIKNTIKDISKQYWRGIEPLKRFVLYVNSYRLNVWYFRFMSWAKHKVLKKQDFA